MRPRPLLKNTRTAPPSLVVALPRTFWQQSRNWLLPCICFCCAFGLPATAAFSWQQSVEPRKVEYQPGRGEPPVGVTTNPPSAPARQADALAPSGGQRGGLQPTSSPAATNSDAGTLATPGLRPSMPQAAWTGSTNAEQPEVQFAGYSTTQEKPQTPTVFSSGANQELGSVRNSADRNASTSQPKERFRLPTASEQENTKATAASSSSSFRPFISMVSSLLIVLGLFFGMVWLYRKSSNNALNGLPKGVVQVLGRTPIATRQHLVVIRFGSKLVLVSLAQGETRTLGEITDPVEVDQLTGMCESNGPNSLSNSFRNILAQGGAQV